MFEDGHSPDEFVRMDAELEVQKAINVYGLEGTEMKIKEIYTHNGGLRDYLLGILYDIWHKK